MELLTAGAALLAERGIEQPFLEAELLLSHLTKTQRPRLYYDPPSLSPRDRAGFFTLIRRRTDRIPLAYLTGSAAFLDFHLSVLPGVLIPRPETELLAEEALRLARHHHAKGPIRLLDIGTGAGPLAIALARGIPGADVLATDISPRALARARANARRLAPRGTIRVVKADIFPSGKKTWHLIVANPPYIPSRGMAALQPEIHHEPAIALEGGADGCLFHRKILSGAAARMEPGGFLLLEMGAGQDRFFRSGRFPGLTLAALKKDLAGIIRIAVFRKKRGAKPADGKTRKNQRR